MSGNSYPLKITFGGPQSDLVFDSVMVARARDWTDSLQYVREPSSVLILVALGLVLRWCRRTQGVLLQARLA